MAPSLLSPPPPLPPTLPRCQCGPPSPAVAWHGRAWQGMAWHGRRRDGLARIGMAGPASAWQGMAWHGRRRDGSAPHGMLARQRKMSTGAAYLAEHGMANVHTARRSLLACMLAPAAIQAQSSVPTSEWLSGQTWVRAEHRCVAAAQPQKSASEGPPGAKPAGVAGHGRKVGVAHSCRDQAMPMAQLPWAGTLLKPPALKLHQHTSSSAVPPLPTLPPTCASQRAQEQQQHARHSMAPEVDSLVLVMKHAVPPAGREGSRPAGPHALQQRAAAAALLHGGSAAPGSPGLAAPAQQAQGPLASRPGSSAGRASGCARGLPGRVWERARWRARRPARVCGEEGAAPCGGIKQGRARRRRPSCQRTCRP